MLRTKSLRLRIVSVLGLNAAVGLLLAISFWWFQSRGDVHSFATHLADSAIHSLVYGTMFGLAMPYLGERLGSLRLPWNWISVIPSLALVAVVATSAVQLLLVRFGHITPQRFWPEFAYKSGTVFLIALVIALSVWGYEKFRDQIEATNLQLQTQQLEKERALKLLTEARLSALESRLQPHFLFNTLNNISALIPENPSLAEEMIQRLASLLRTSLDRQSDGYVALHDEIKLVRDYAEIEKIRLGERLSLSIDIPTELEHLKIPPMTLQPLVENSIKYAVAPRIEGGEIRVSAKRENGRLTLSVWDDGPGFAIEQIASGHSIDNLKARLRNMLGNEATTSVSCEGHGALVTISLPFKTNTVAGEKAGYG
jgi:signal transduction histidine kinase